MLKLWKGLFYCMWMSDKPLVQVNKSSRKYLSGSLAPRGLSRVSFVSVSTYRRN